MDMIEVDPKLFVTCRLCLEEIGVYQIVPEVQKKIKYCFDLHISLFDGLPQLICKKCESMLRHHAHVKDMLHEKQKSLLIKLKGKIKSDTAQDEQKPTLSVYQKDAEKNDILVKYNEKSEVNIEAEINKDKDKDNDIKQTLDTTKKSSYKDIICDGGNTEPLTEIKHNKSLKSKWRRNYIKQYVCKYCSSSQRHRANIILHSEKCAFMQKYSPMVKWCWVNLKNLNVKPNLTDSRENVVWEKTKIINSKNPNYYILYSLKTQKRSSSESSDENFTTNKKKRKRRRIMSESSNETLVLDNYFNKENSISKCAGESDIECVTLDDSDNASSLNTFAREHNYNSEKSTVHVKNKDGEKIIKNMVSLYNNKHLKNDKYLKNDIECVSLDDSDNGSTFSIFATEQDNNSEISTVNVRNEDAEKVIKNIVSACNNKYFKNAKNYRNDDSSLQRKLLSMGRKIIHKEGFNPTGLLRYMEQKDLDVDWIEKIDTNVTVRATLKEKKSDEDGVIWKSLTKLDHDYKTKDFIDNFEKLSASEANSTNSNLVCTDKVNSQDGENVISSGMVLQQKALVTSGNDSSPSIFSSQNSNNKNSHTPKCSTTNKNNVLLRPIKENTMLIKKLLNANPVPNPKKLNTRNAQDCLPAVDTTDSCNDEMLRDKAVPATTISQTNSLHMPIITSAVSLAPNFDTQITSNEEQCPSSEGVTPLKVPEQTLPRIKVRSVSELMPKELNHLNGFATTANVWAGNSNENQNVYLQNIAPKPQLTSVPVYMSLAFNGVQTFPLAQIQAVQLNTTAQGTSQSLQRQEPDTPDHIVMHTTELPKTRTNSPFQYFKDLLKIHNYDLLINVEATSLFMSCIINFKMVFEQGDIGPVTLSLSLFCEKNTFCIQVKDLNSKLLYVNRFSAHWQWEILKGFRSDVGNRMLQNAKKFGQEMCDRISYFISLLNTIVVS